VSFFLLLSQKKETKEKATPYRLFPETYIIMGRQAKLATLKQSLAESSPLLCKSQARKQGIKSRPRVI